MRSTIRDAGPSAHVQRRSSQDPASVRKDEAATRRVAFVFEHRLGADRVRRIARASASEDFGLFAAAWGIPSVFWPPVFWPSVFWPSVFWPSVFWPSVFWFVGGTDPELYAASPQAGRLDQLPANQAPHFAARFIHRPASISTPC